MELTKIQEKIRRESGTALVVSMVAGLSGSVIAAVYLILVIATGISPGVNHPSPETALTDILTSSAPWILNGLLIGIISIFTSKLFHRIRRSYTPFSKENTDYIRSIALTATAMGLAVNVFDLVSSLVLDFDIRLRTFTFFYLLIGVVIGLLARINDYGCLLQQESDETL